MTVVETGENQKKLILQTHYYKASYDQIKKVYLDYLDEFQNQLMFLQDLA